MVSNALASARSGYSNSDWQTRNQLAQSGLLNSSFGQQIMQGMNMQGGQDIADIPAAATSQFIGAAAPGVLNMGAGGPSALGAAGSLSQTTSTTPSFMDYLMKGLSSGGQAGMGLGMMGL